MHLLDIALGAEPGNRPALEAKKAASQALLEASGGKNLSETMWLRSEIAEIEAGQFEWKLDLEDVHLNIEARLTERVGIVGKRLHTGRSRNDQVATDVRLWLRGEIDEIGTLLGALQRVLVEQADRHADVILPGFTHLQVAQPVSFGHHLLA